MAMYGSLLLDERKLDMKKFVYGSLLILAVWATQAQADFVQGGDFTQYDAWYCGIGATPSWTENEYMVLYGNGSWFNQDITADALPEKMDYEISFWAATLTGDLSYTYQIKVYATYCDDSDSVISTEIATYTLASNNDWQNFVFTGKTPDGVSHTILMFERLTNPTDVGGSGGIDNVVGRIPATQMPTFDPAGPEIAGTTTVTISSSTANARIYYTTNGAIPTTSGTQYSNPTKVTIRNDGTTLKAIAVGTDSSSLRSQTYEFADFIQGGDFTQYDVWTYGAGTTPSWTENEYAVLYGSGTWISQNITAGALPENTHYKIRYLAATLTGDLSYTYQIKVSAVYYDGSDSVISTETATYTLASNNDWQNFIFTGVAAQGTDHTTLSIGRFSFPTTAGGSAGIDNVVGTILPNPETEAPVFTAGSETGLKATVTISSATTNAKIYYTTNGETPTTEGTESPNPTTVTVNNGMTLKAIAVANDTSWVTSQTYLFENFIQGGNFTNHYSAWTYGTGTTPSYTGYAIFYGNGKWINQDVSANVLPASSHYEIRFQASRLTGSLADRSQFSVSAIYYDASGKYLGFESSDFTLANNFNWQNFTFSGMTPNNLAYTIITFDRSSDAGEQGGLTNVVGVVIPDPETHMPTFTPSGPEVADNTTVTIRSATAGAKIYYTTNGEVPTTSGIEYPNPTTLTVSDGRTIKAIAAADDVSWVASQTYVWKATVPVFVPATKYISGPTSISMSSATTGATIYYTTNGKTPTTSSTVYTHPVTVNDGTTLKAIAVSSGYGTSLVTSVSYVTVPETNRGRWWVKNHPFQICAIADKATDIQQYSEVGFSSYMATFLAGGFDGKIGAASRADMGWHWFYRWDSELSNEEFISYLTYLTKTYPGILGVNVGDETDVSEYSSIAQRIAQVKSLVPDAIVYHASLGLDSDRDEYVDYLDKAVNVLNVDLLMYDNYPFNDNTTDNDFYINLGIVRERALAAGIPYWNWMQGHGWDYDGTLRQDPSESEIRFQAFMSLAYGYSGLAYWTYDETGSPYTNAIMTSTGDISPIGIALEGAIDEIKNIGEVSKNLTSTGVFYVTASGESQPTETVGWTTQTGYPISSVTVNSGSKGFVVGLFRGDDNRKYFMVVNSNHAAYTNAADTAASVTITFNSSLNSIQRINRSTGAKETVTLTNHALSSYSLPGGTGDLFCLTIPGDANGDGAVNVTDLSVLAAYYNTTGGATWAMGDFDGDKDVDVADLSILAANYNSGSSSTMSWAEAYAQAFGTTSDDANSSSDASSDDSEDTTSSTCSSLGLSLIAGLMMLGLMIVKLEE
jgi:LysM repeat protein